MNIKTKEQLIESPLKSSPHVVLLGAGASRAAFPNGDRSSQQIPLMNDLVDVIGLKPMIEQAGGGLGNEINFETIYSRLISNPKHEDIAEKIERAVEEYFSSLSLPNEATIYDRILLSLRPGDAVFTFNWDPFLFDAYQRNHHVVPLPGIYFLHGNVRIGNCPHHEDWGGRQMKCPICSTFFENVPLLYPTEKKGYSNNPYIKRSWDEARFFFKNALMLTIFGYSAPDSDIDAVDLLRSAWFERSDRKIEHVEIIDIDCGSTLYERWKPFTPTFHIKLRQDFNDSFAAQWPRRSREAIFFPSIYGEPCEQFPLETTSDLAEIQRQIREIARWESDDER